MIEYPFTEGVQMLHMLGVPLEPPQEHVVNGPGGQSILVAWTVPDPLETGGNIEWRWIRPDGMPLVIPMVLEARTADTPRGFDYYVADELGKQREMTLGDEIWHHSEQENPFTFGATVGELDSMVEATKFMTPTLTDPDDLIVQSPAWNSWTIASNLEAAELGAYVEDQWRASLIDPVFYYLHDLASGADETEVDAQYGELLDDRGYLLPGEQIVGPLLTIEKNMPRHLRYLWDRLIYQSQQGWDAYMATQDTSDADVASLERTYNPWSLF